LGFIRRYRDVFLVVLLLVVPFFFLRASIRQPEEQNAIDRALMRIATPFEWAASAAARGVSGVLGEYFLLVDVGRDNDRLSRDVARLRHDVRELARIKAENERLRELLGLKKSLEYETLSAVVTTKSATAFFRVIHVALDHGEARVRPNMPVVALGGAVGLIKTVTGDAATVHLVPNSGFGVDVVAPRTGARGFVRGTGDEKSYTVKVEYFQRADEVEVGDLLVTSGVGCRFPPGIAVAKVTRVVKRDFGSYQQVEAEPTVDFSRLEEVLVVVREPKDCEAGPAVGGRP
jgi:rod shape-determining protein MreC